MMVYLYFCMFLFVCLNQSCAVVCFFGPGEEIIEWVVNKLGVKVCMLGSSMEPLQYFGDGPVVQLLCQGQGAVRVATLQK